MSDAPTMRIALTMRRRPGWPALAKRSITVFGPMAHVMRHLVAGGVARVRHEERREAAAHDLAPQVLRSEAWVAAFAILFQYEEKTSRTSVVEAVTGASSIEKQWSVRRT